MKKIIFAMLTVSCSLFYYSSNAQYCGNSVPSVCTPNPNQGPGFENPDSIPCVVRGQATSTTISFKMYTIFNFLGSQVVDSIQFLGIDNLPCGLCWATN